MVTEPGVIHLTKKDKRFLVAASIGSGLLTLAGLAVIAFMVILPFHKPKSGPDVRIPPLRMADYYGEKFSLISRRQVDSYDDIIIYTLKDSNGLECHAVYGKDYCYSSFKHRTYDDYRVQLQEQTPAVQRLLAQDVYQVFYQSNLGQVTAFNDDYPDCRWVIMVDDYNEIPNALHLALDTVTAEDSKLPDSEFWLADNWGSLAPEIQLGTEELAVLPFHDPDGYDFDALLKQAQKRYLDLYRGEALETGVQDPPAAGGVPRS